ncbi:Hypothetical protein R9X50_00282800 [Acrodontium crateriforme]|uniref:5'-nucleotidase n=1 Tax=Acrodontium crateriforme TaxID=150365 RepID=A0AAQ3M397_9PEZI|nr:Hypothetical protein R9X50_00282800 [Acrodontium crateriforme]
MANVKGSTKSETITYSSGNTAGIPDLRFIHYNDVYHVEAGSREPVGGISRFKTLCDYYQSDATFGGQPDCITLFSGDAFNPSLESSVTKGKHMVPALNALSTSAACLGNHDLDFGVEQFQYLASLCTFPWLCANVLDPALGVDMPLGNCKRSVMLTASNGIKIGCIGLVEQEWLDTINTLPPNLIFVEPAEVVRELVPGLRADGAEIIIAITHQRQPNDDRLARELEPNLVDIILSGHDHFYAHSVVNGTHILRSGTDFKQLSYLEARKNGSGKWDFNIWRRDVISSIAEEPVAVQMVEKLTKSLKAKLERPIGYTSAPLDARFSTVRMKESNLGNFVCDIMRFHYNADCCIMAAGTIRGDQIYPPGVLKVKDIMNCFPFEDPCVVIGVSGNDVLHALENAVSKYPAQEGRFPQVSNIKFAFDPSQHEGQRCSDVFIKDQPIDLEREYTLVTRDYMARGKDGFHSLMVTDHGGTARSIVSDENGLLISMLLRQYFMNLKVLGRWKNLGTQMMRHWSSIEHGVHQKHPVQQPVEASKSLPFASSTNSSLPQRQAAAEHSDSEDESTPDVTAFSVGTTIPTHQHTAEDRELMLKRRVVRKWWRLAGLTGHPSMCEEQGHEFGVHWAKSICPRLEGRIRIVGGHD